MPKGHGKAAIEKGVVDQNIGILIVLTGASGSGKDCVLNELLKHSVVKELGISKVITCTDRTIRKHESPDSYHFVSSKELDRMSKNNELAEVIVDTGTSRKATPKSEISRLFSGTNLIWRIDPSLAARIVSGTYFDERFPGMAKVLKENTIVVYINALREVIESRRKRREGDKYSPEDFRLRDEQEAPHLDILQKEAVVVENPDNRLAETVETVAGIIANHHEKIKIKKT